MVLKYFLMSFSIQLITEKFLCHGGDFFSGTRLIFVNNNYMGKSRKLIFFHENKIQNASTLIFDNRLHSCKHKITQFQFYTSFS